MIWLNQKLGILPPDQINKENKMKIENKAYDEIISTLPDSHKIAIW